MFTGIVAAVGHIVASSPLEGGVQLTIEAGRLDLDDVMIGDSIAVNGCCLTVIRKEANSFFVDVSLETIRCTTGLNVNANVNLEKALRLADRLGGHLVSGHVDGIGEVTKFEQVGESWLLRVKASRELLKFIAKKGSITMNGTSLTVNEVNGEEFDVNLIPHTLESTTLKELKPGYKLNLEVDLIARYCERILAYK